MASASLRPSRRDAEEIERAYEVARWWTELRDSSNEAFLPLYACEARYLVLKGGGGSGKSIFAGRKVLERCLAEPGHRFLVCRKVARTLRESCFQQLRSQISRHYPDENVTVNLSDMGIRFANGSEILFTGLDDVEKLKSITDITGIWIEEASELLKSDFNQLDIRLRGETPYYKQIILTFNPVSILHWLKRRFFDNHDPRAVTHESTYRDNRFLDAENIATLESFKESDPYYYSVYCLGEWGVSGQSVFDAQKVTERLLALSPPLRTGYFAYDYDGLSISGVRFVEDRTGPVKIYKEPEAKMPYVIGADTAGDGSDSFVAQVLDNRTGEQVCTLRQQTDEDVFTKQLFCLGIWYNVALVAVECNFSTFPTMELNRLRYPKQYVREVLDSYTRNLRHAFGFRTDKNTRNVILSELIESVRENTELYNDRTTLEEMLTFVRNEQFRPEAEEGAHDDCVMALAIALHARCQQRYTPEPDLVEPEQDERFKRLYGEDYDTYMTGGSDADAEYLLGW